MRRVIAPANNVEELLVCLVEEIEGLRADLQAGAESPAVAADDVSAAAARLAHHKVEERVASEDGTTLEKAKVKKAAAKPKAKTPRTRRAAAKKKP